MTRTVQRDLYAAYKAGALDFPKTGETTMQFTRHPICIDIPEGYLDDIDCSFRIDTVNDCAVLREFTLGKLICDRKRAVLIMGEDEVIAAEAEAYDAWLEVEAYWGTQYDRIREQGK